jgi:hypothetical protein
MLQWFRKFFSKKDSVAVDESLKCKNCEVPYKINFNSFNDSKANERGFCTVTCITDYLLKRLKITEANVDKLYRMVIELNKRL